MNELVSKIDLAEKLKGHLNSVIDGSLELVKNLILAVIVFYIGKYLLKLLLKLVKRIMERRKIDVTVSKFVLNILKISLQVALFIIIIGILGVKTSSIMALIAATGFGIGLALSGTMQNFANGILLLLFRPYRIGDYIEVNGVGGTVKAIQIFHTILTTSDNKTIYVPNGTMGTATMVNYNIESTRRIEWTISINYKEDFDRAKSVLEGIIASEDKVLADPKPLIEINQLANSSIVMLVRCWVNSEDYWTVFYSVNKKTYELFNQNKIDFSFPQITVYKA